MTSIYFKTKSAVALSMMAIALSACDTSELHSVAYVGEESPHVYMGKGARLVVSEDQVANVYGHDICPVNAEGRLGGTPDGTPGCTKLTGRTTVRVRLKVADGPWIEESWTVTAGVGPTATGIQLTRPNGWVVREAKD